MTSELALVSSIMKAKKLRFSPLQNLPILPQVNRGHLWTGQYILRCTGCSYSWLSDCETFCRPNGGIGSERMALSWAGAGLLHRRLGRRVEWK